MLAVSLIMALSTAGLHAQSKAPAVPAPPMPPEAAASEAPKDYSQAERLIFMTDQLGALKAPTTLRYTFRKSGSLEEAFNDTVTMNIKRQPDGSCCIGGGDFLSGTRRMSLPDVEDAKGNPVTVFFLEHDVRDMNRLTKGSQSYFRKRIRMAIYQGATVDEVSLPYQGRTVKGREIRIRPYDDDPMVTRFERYARKTYSFLLADDVPGGVYGIRSRIADAKAGADPLIVEELYIEGADPAKTPFTP